MRLDFRGNRATFQSRVSIFLFARVSVVDRYIDRDRRVIDGPANRQRATETVTIIT